MLAEMARNYVERDEGIRREKEMRKRKGERLILKDNGGTLKLPKRKNQ